MASGNIIETWPIIEGFSCGACGGPARQNPADNHEWGCAFCNGSTHSVALNFMKVMPRKQDRLDERTVRHGA